MKVLSFVLTLSVLIVSTIGCQSQSSKNDSSGFANLNVADFEKGLKNDPNAVLLDVRSPEEFAETKIAGAANLDFYSDNFEQKLADWDKSKAYYVYCHSGSRSSKTAQMMNRMGFTKVYNLNGGIVAWKASGR
jgi:rhodanese-related sulfurtransferase